MEHAVLRPVIRFETAKDLVDRTVSFATDNGWTVAAVVVDPSGHVIAAGRMDGVPAPVFDYANDKAYTAGTLGKSTRAFFERMSSSPDLSMGMINRDRLCAWDGGLPIVEDGQLIGGLGVSGAQGHEDIACAEAALVALGLSG